MKKSSKLKEFALSSWAIDRGTLMYVVIGLFFFLDISAYLNMPRENYPEINTNEVFVSSVFPGNTPEDMERLITDPLEEELKGVPNLKKITSSSLENFSLITVEFDENITKESAKIKVQDKIDNVVSNVSVALACVVTSTNAGNVVDSVAPGVTATLKLSEAVGPT